jgi:hypothetical protein
MAGNLLRSAIAPRLLSIGMSYSYAFPPVLSRAPVWGKSHPAARDCFHIITWSAGTISATSGCCCLSVGHKTEHPKCRLRTALGYVLLGACQLPLTEKMVAMMLRTPLEDCASGSRRPRGVAPATVVGLGGRCCGREWERQKPPSCYQSSNPPRRGALELASGRAEQRSRSSTVKSRPKILIKPSADRF